MQSLQKKLHIILSLILISPLFIYAKPNIVFIVADDLKPEFNIYESSLPTPEINKLAQEGTYFTKAYCQLAQCTQSRVSVLTGKRPDTTRVYKINDVMRKLNPGIVTLPQHLKDNGYTTAAIGKIFDPRSVLNRQKSDEPSWSLPWLPSWKLDYDEKFGKPATFYHNPIAKKMIDGVYNYNEQRKLLQDNGLFVAYESQDVPDDAYPDGAIANQAIKYLNEFSKEKSPFFLAVGFKRPHLPFVAPKKYWDIAEEHVKLAEFQKQSVNGPSISYQDSWELRGQYSGVPEGTPLPEDYQTKLVHGYLACTAYLDTQIGKIVNEIKKLNLSEDTIIVLWGDHGFHLGDHGMFCKHSNFEQATRVPLIIRAPNGVVNNNYNHPVELLDLFPTLCDLTGIDTPEDLEGVSLSKIIKDNQPLDKKYAISQYKRNNIWGYSIRDDQFRYTEWIDQNKNLTDSELYDYQNDPLETINIVGDEKYIELINDLHEKLHRLL